jgi:putative peptidoglycan lipid II flippase
MSPHRGSRIRLSAILVVLAGLNLGGGFLMHGYVLARIGAGVETDALFAGLALPQVVLAIIASSFMHVIVPLLTGSDDHQFRRDAWAFAATTLAAFVSIAGILAVFAPQWTPLIAPGLPGPARPLLIQIARIQLIGMVCTALAGVLWAVHRARHHFIWAESAPLAGTILAWGFLLVMLPRWGVHAAAWAQVLRVGVHAAMLAPGLGRFPGFAGSLAMAALAWRRLRPLMLGTAYGRIEPIADRALSSLAAAGDLSLYYLCQQVGAAALQITNNALIAPTVPVLAAEAKDERWTAFRATLRQSARTVVAATATGFALLVLGGLAFGATARGSASAIVPRAWWLIVGLGGVLVATPLAESCRTAFYAMGQTARPVRIDAAVFTLGLVLKVAGFLAFGVWGMAIAASAHAILSVLALRAGLQHAIPAGDGRPGRLP